MRRPLFLLVLAAALVLTGGPTGAVAAPAPSDAQRAERALATVQQLLTGATTATARRATAPPVDATVAVRDLVLALPHLRSADRSAAERLLARPSASSRTCGRHVCVHWSPAVATRPWARTTLRHLGSVWATEVRRLGYRAPVRDGDRGGDGRLDVYLRDVGSQGLYGYCAPEQQVRGQRWLASGYCVLDDDFAREQYGVAPRDSLRVTAAHEFFHAVQFGYDYREDGWLMEATATWMEERVADGVDDNRQYLPYGQVGTPATPLDRFDIQGYAHYGNWPFFEHLSARFGVGVVRSVWTQAGAYPAAGGRYSTQAVEKVLARYGGLRRVYRGFASANTTPDRSYAEGRAWPTAQPSTSWRLGRDRSSAQTRMRIDHLASRTVTVRPERDLRDRRWRLRISVDGPPRTTSPAAVVVSRTRSGVERRVVGLGRRGDGSTTVGFSARQVSRVTVVLVNASTRSSCWHRTSWSCQGRPRDDDQRFSVRASAVAPGSL